MRWWRKERPYADIDDGTLEVLAAMAQGHFEARAKVVQVYEGLHKKRDKELRAELEELFEQEFPEQADADMAATWVAVEREQRYRRRRGRK